MQQTKTGNINSDQYVECPKADRNWQFSLVINMFLKNPRRTGYKSVCGKAKAKQK